MDRDALIARYIEPHPANPGIGEFRLKEEYNGYPVWSIIGSLMPDGSNMERMAREYEIPLEAIVAARAYYARHKQEIDDRPAANRAA